MKRIVVVMLLFGLAFMAGCSGSTETAVDQAVVPKTKNSYTAAEVLKAFKDAELPLGRVDEYTAETDPNSLLGRPNQYTGKFSFEDSRIAVPDSESLTGGTVEVFGNREDLEARKAYVEAISKNLPMLGQYIYVHKNILLRVDFGLAPEEAEEYEVVLKNL